MVKISNFERLIIVHEALELYKKQIVKEIEGVTDIFTISSSNRKINYCNGLLKSLKNSIIDYNKKLESD